MASAAIRTNVDSGEATDGYGCCNEFALNVGGDMSVYARDEELADGWSDAGAIRSDEKSGWKKALLTSLSVVNGVFSSVGRDAFELEKSDTALDDGESMR